MAYQNQFVAAIISDGKILRETRENGDDFISLPFGSEYSFKFKNLNSTRVAVTVTIDGEDVLDGQKLVVDPNDDLDLEGFMSGSAARNRFKFIEKTQQISDYRGDKIDDGLIRIGYQFEKKPTVVERRRRVIKVKKHYDYWEPWRITPRPPYWYEEHNDNIRYSSSSNSCDSLNYDHDCDSIETETKCSAPLSISGEKSMLRNRQVKPAARRLRIDIPENDDGITVKGNDVYQSFNHTHLKEMEEASHTMVLRLRGFNSAKKKLLAR